jgi:ArsR family transcriptional regulator
MDSEQAVAALAALGNGLRLEIWRMLLPYGSIGLPAGLIAARLAVPPSSLSFHLQQLTHGKVLLQRRSSRQIIYAVNNGAIDRLWDFLNQDDGLPIPGASLSAGEACNIVGD